MKNYVHDGGQLALVAPYDVVSGGGLLIGTLFGVAVHSALNAAPIEVATTGVFDLTKVGSQAWALGAAVYWDNTNKVCTTTASGNTLIGKAVAAVGSGAGETVGRVRLNG